jgi:hypothetical protein
VASAALQHSQVARPEGLRDDDLCIREVLLELGARAVLVARDDELVALAFEPFTKAEAAGDAAEELARLEVDGLHVRREGGDGGCGAQRRDNAKYRTGTHVRRRCRLAVCVLSNLGDGICAGRITGAMRYRVSYLNTMGSRSRRLPQKLAAPRAYLGG